MHRPQIDRQFDWQVHFCKTVALAFILAIINLGNCGLSAVNETSVIGARPNIVWIMSEDNSKHYLKMFDEMGAETPNIRKMAKQGVTFTRAFSNAPVCSVARTTLITGVYAPRLGTQFHRRTKLA